MKKLFKPMAFCVFASFIQAAIPPDTNVALLKVKEVTIEDDLIVIVADQATTLVTLIAGDPDPAHQGETRDGKPVATVRCLSNEAIFTIKQDRYSKPGGPTEKAWKDSLAWARRLQEGKDVEVVGIAFYAPDIVIKRHRITSVTGFGYLHVTGR